jgi:serine protease Do
MSRTRTLWRRTSLAIGLVAVAAVIAIISERGFGASATAPLWTDRPIIARPVARERLPWVELAGRLKPAVVNVNTKRTEQGLPKLQGDGSLDQFFGQSFRDLPPHTVRSLGSGFLINPDGYVVTNNHVVDGATEIRVKLSDGREFSAEVIGRDARTDVALLKIAATGLPVIPLGDSSEMQVGEPVMAIGNPFGLEQTVTTGIVSAMGRVIGAGPYDEFIQTDASINPGNSGGPLINDRGQAIGINAAIFTSDGGSTGIGFAIPISLTKPVITDLVATGHVVRGWLGVAVQPLTPDIARSLDVPDTEGALVASVVKDSPARKAGLRPGDIIVEYDGRPVGRPEGLPRAVAKTAIGREVSITVVRDGRRLALTAKIEQLAEQPRPTTASVAPEKAALGVEVQSLTPQIARQLGISERAGVLVRGVEDPSPAAEVGIQVGDVIVEVDRHSVKTVDDLTRGLRQHRSSSPVLLLINRNGDSLFVALH